jgi:hypothetical protein
VLPYRPIDGFFECYARDERVVRCGFARARTIHFEPVTWYDFWMITANTSPALDRLLGPLGDCLTRESAERLLELKADPQLQAIVDDLAARNNRGLLTPDERAEYGEVVRFGTFVAILKSKARQLLANSEGQ